MRFTIPDDTDAPAEAVPEFPRDYWANSFNVDDDGDVSADVKERVPILLRSTNDAQDMFALAFLVIEIFSGLSPSTSARAFQIFRLATRGQRPSPPGRLAELRGLDRFYWQFCLSCLGFGDANESTLAQRYGRLARDWDVNVTIRPPLDLPYATVQRLNQTIVDLHPQVHDVHDVRDGRDAEAQLYEVQGTWKRDNEEPVLVKVVTPTLCRRGSLRRPEDFQAEAFVWKQLRHPNLLPLLGTVRYEDTACFVTHWMAGGTCVDFLQANPGADRLRILIQVADALHYLHTREPAVIHGYVRASNIFVSESGDAFLGNFDFQPLQDPERNFDGSRIDDAGRWTPPEANAATDRTTKTDVWSFSMMAYELYS
ncbi:kinase-like protein, partial [Exidia glandulosa HHB12029]